MNSNLDALKSDALQSILNWRSSKKTGGSSKAMPDSLWEKAIHLSNEIGINPTASLLGLSYTRACPKSIA